MADPTIQLPSRRRRGNVFQRAGIGQKIMGVVLLVLIVAVANIAVIKSQLDDFHDMAATVNIAGKLRWLSQRLAVEAVGLPLGATTGAANIQHDIHSVERNLQVLRLGGIIGNQEIRGLDSIHAAPLDLVEDAWLNYKADLEQVVEAYQPTSTVLAGEMLVDPERQNILIRSGSMKMLQYAEGLMASIVYESQRKHSQTVYSMYVLLLMDIMALLAMFMLSRKYIIKPLRALVDHSKEMISGNYDARIDYSSADEIGELALSFNRSAEQIGKLITELQDEQEQLRESGAMFMGVAANTMVGIYIIQDNSFRFVNHKMATMLGYESAAQLMAGNVLDIFMPIDRALVHDSIERRLRGDELETRFERRVLRHDKRVLFLECFCSVIALGGIPSLTGVALDITQRKEAEASLQLAEN